MLFLALEPVFSRDLASCIKPGVLKFEEPHLSQMHEEDMNSLPHSLHRLMPISTSITFFFNASFSNRLFPPYSPTGKIECGAGVISRSFDFSGRPIRTPILVGALFLVFTRVDSSRLKSPVIPKHFNRASGSSIAKEPFSM